MRAPSTRPWGHSAAPGHQHRAPTLSQRTHPGTTHPPPPPPAPTGPRCRIAVHRGVMSPVVMATLLHHCVAVRPNPGISVGAAGRGAGTPAAWGAGVTAAAHTASTRGRCQEGNAVKLLRGTGPVGSDRGSDGRQQHVRPPRVPPSCGHHGTRCPPAPTAPCVCWVAHGWALGPCCTEAAVLHRCPLPLVPPASKQLPPEIFPSAGKINSVRGAGCCPRPSLWDGGQGRGWGHSHHPAAVVSCPRGLATQPPVQGAEEQLPPRADPSVGMVPAVAAVAALTPLVAFLVAEGAEPAAPRESVSLPSTAWDGGVTGRAAPGAALPPAGLSWMPPWGGRVSPCPNPEWDHRAF